MFNTTLRFTIIVTIVDFKKIKLVYILRYYLFSFYL